MSFRRRSVIPNTGSGFGNRNAGRADAVAGAPTDAARDGRSGFRPLGDETGRAERDQRSLLRMFVGANADRFERIYERTNDKNPYRFRFANINVVAGLFGIPWFFYRKLYVEGALVTLVPVVFGIVLPDFKFPMAAVVICCALMANPYYLQKALNKIREIEASGVSEAARNEAIARAGGTSTAGAILGAAIVASCFLLAFIVAFAAKMPGAAGA